MGDEVTANIRGSVYAEWRVSVDPVGEFAPRVSRCRRERSGGHTGSIAAMDLNRSFKCLELAAAVTDLGPRCGHGTGIVERPSGHVEPGLITTSQVLSLARVPSTGGSDRRVWLLRKDSVVVILDLCTLFSFGSRRVDVLLQPDDVLDGEAVGPQPALYGRINRAAVFKLLLKESVGDLLCFAVGFSLVDRIRPTLERSVDRDSGGAVEVALLAGEGMLPVCGSFGHDSKRDLGFYAKRAGGATAGANHELFFVASASGSEVSAGQNAGWSFVSRFESSPALTGKRCSCLKNLIGSACSKGLRTGRKSFSRLGWV